MFVLRSPEIYSSHDQKTQKMNPSTSYHDRYFNGKFRHLGCEQSNQNNAKQNKEEDDDENLNISLPPPRPKALKSRKY